MVESTAYRRIIFLINAAGMSFCGFGYQQLMALALSDATGDYVLSQAVSLGLFLLGMGVGSGCIERARGSWSRLLDVEWALALAGSLSVAYLHSFEIGLRFFGFFHGWYLILAAAPLIIGLGFLNGCEIPLLLKLNSDTKPGAILGAGYLGSF